MSGDRTVADSREGVGPPASFQAGSPYRAWLSGQDRVAQSQAHAGSGPLGRVLSTRGDPGSLPGVLCFSELSLSGELAARPSPERKPQQGLWGALPGPGGLPPICHVSWTGQACGPGVPSAQKGRGHIVSLSSLYGSLSKAPLHKLR